MGTRILVLSDRIGSGNDELGRVLMRNFIYSLARNPARPVAVMFANEAVRLACEGSEVLDDLSLLVEDGVAVRACGTCLDFLGITDTLSVGEVGVMPDMVSALLGDDRVVTIA